jgi:hypothetical protein
MPICLLCLIFLSPSVEDLIDVVLRLFICGLEVSEFLLEIFDVAFRTLLLILEALLNIRKLLQHEPALAYRTR